MGTKEHFCFKGFYNDGIARCRNTPKFALFSIYENIVALCGNECYSAAMGAVMRDSRVGLKHQLQKE